MQCVRRDVAGMTRGQWLAERRKGVSASDVAGILGLSKWDTPLSVYLDKRGLLEEKSAAHLEWGHRLEPVIAEAYLDRVGLCPHHLEPSALCVHPKEPWLLATPDRFVLGADGRVERLLELKTAGQDDGWGEEGTDQVPDYYLTQVQHQMHVTGVPVTDLAVLIRGSDFRVYTVAYSPELYAAVLPILRTFWRMVENGEPPAPDYSHPDTPKLLDLLHRPAAGVRVSLGDDVLALARDYVALRARAGEADRESDRVRAALTAAMGEASAADLPDGTQVVRTLVRAKGYTVEPKEYVRLTVRAPKGGL